MTDETVTTQKRADSMTSIADMVCDVMTEGYNDGKSTPMEKMKLLEKGTRAVISIKRTQIETAKTLMKMGVKANGDLESLTLLEHKD